MDGVDVKESICFMNPLVYHQKLQIFTMQYTHAHDLTV